MRDFALQFEAAFHRLGVRLGRELAGGMRAGHIDFVDQEPTGNVPRQAPEGEARILPGLTGRRRRPGEAAPRCGRAGCNKPSRTRGYCQTHYVQWLKAGEGSSRNAG